MLMLYSLNTIWWSFCSCTSIHVVFITIILASNNNSFSTAAAVDNDSLRSCPSVVKPLEKGHHATLGC